MLGKMYGKCFCRFKTVKILTQKLKHREQELIRSLIKSTRTTRLEQGELLRSKAMRKELVARALHVRGAVRAAFVEESMRGST